MFNSGKPPKRRDPYDSYKIEQGKRRHKQEIDEALAVFYAKQERSTTRLDEVRATHDIARQPTIAQRIANKLGKDNRRWKTSRGVSFEILVLDKCPMITVHEQDTIIRYAFEDKSAIVATPHYWFVETENQNIRTVCTQTQQEPSTD